MHNSLFIKKPNVWHSDLGDYNRSQKTHLQEYINSEYQLN